MNTPVFKLSLMIGNLKVRFSAQYKQIGNAVPVNLAYAVGRVLIRLLNEIESASST